MTRTLLTLMAATTLSGCIFFRSPPKLDSDKDRPDTDTDTDLTETDTDTTVDTDTDPVIDTDGRDTDTDTPDTDLAAPFLFDPATAAVGDDTILVVSTGGVIDLSTVLELRFFGTGDITVTSTRVQGPDALLVAISVPDDATPGVQDVLVRFTNGTGLWLEDVFTVTP